MSKESKAAVDAKADASPGDAVIAALAGKYMTFRLDREVYGLPILKVRELIGMQEITRVPGAPAFSRGVINLRGKVVPVIDLRLKFGLAGEAPTLNVVIIVLQIAGPSGALTMGVVVDEVLEVREIGAAQIEPPPSFGSRSAETDFILGVGKSERSVVFLLDVDRVLTTNEITRLTLDGQAPDSGSEAA